VTVLGGLGQHTERSPVDFVSRGWSDDLDVGDDVVLALTLTVSESCFHSRSRSVTSPVQLYDMRQTNYKMSSPNSSWAVGYSTPR
jgi:hypothetical protein